MLTKIITSTIEVEPQRKYVRKFIFHHEFLLVSVSGADQRLLRWNVVETEFVKLVLEVVFGTDSEIKFVFELFGYLQYSIPPVIGT